MPEKFFTIKAKFEAENKVNVTLSVNEATYGTLTSESNLTGLKKGDKVELVAARNPDGYEDFLLWYISGTEGTDYTIDNDPEVPGKATLTVLGTKDISVMAVFRGKVVGLQTSGRKYAIASSLMLFPAGVRNSLGRNFSRLAIWDASAGSIVMV